MTSATDDFRRNERMEGRTLIIDGAEFADTREKLEEDVRQLCSTHGWESASPFRSASGLIRAALDRQAAITERECNSAAWKANYEHMKRRADGLAAERDHMQRVIQAQAESFRKLEAASAMPADCTDCRHLDELRKLKRRIVKLARKAGV